MKTPWPTPEQLIELAKEAPDALEALRVREIESVINSAPHHLQPRLRGLQFQIDAKRRLSKTPMASCLEVFHMMYDSFHDLNDALNDTAENSRPNHKAKVLMFPAVSRG